MALKINTQVFSHASLPNQDLPKEEKEFRLDLMTLSDQSPSESSMQAIIKHGKEVLKVSTDPLSLIKLLLKNLIPFPILYQEQLDLAVIAAQNLLIQAQETPIDARLALYTTATHYYGKAISIASMFDPYQMKSLFTQASKIFMLVVNDQVVSSKSFQKRLDRASGFTNLSPFQTIFDEIVLLKNYRCDSYDHQVILSLYEQAQEVLLGVQKTKEDTTSFASFARHIRQAQQEKYAPQNSPTAIERYQSALKNFRDTFERQRIGLTQEQVRDFQKTMHQEFLIFFQIFLKDAFSILGSPPCAYDLRACGSLAREEFCPYSDLEWMILIEDLKYTPYFKTLAQILNLQIVSFGETAATDLPVFSALGGMNCSGFHVDTGGNPATDNLIGTPQTLALLQKGEENDGVPTFAFHSLRRTTSLEQKSSPLFESYNQAVHQILDQNNLRQRRALQFLKARLEQYKACFKNTWRQEPYLNIKENFVELLYHPLSDLALYFNCKEQNTLDLIDALPCFTPDSRLLLREAVSGIYLIRTRLHLQYGEQKEIASQIDQPVQNVLPLLQEEKFLLEKIYCLIFRPFYGYLDRVFNEESPSFDNMDLLNLAFEEACLKGLFCRATIFHLVKHLLLTNQNPKLFYERLSLKLAPLESLREVYVEALEDAEEKETLASVPNPKGYRQIERMKRQELHDSILGILTPQEERSSHGYSVSVTTPALPHPSYLKKELLDEILNPQTGDLQGIYKNTHSRVTRSEKYQLHFKQAPSNPNKESPFHPGKEQAASSLMFRLFGHGMSVGELVEFTVDHPKQGKKQYLVHVSKTILGTNLTEASDQKLKRVDPISLTDFFLSLPLLLPGDMRPANMVMQGDQLVSIDNDVSWVRPMTQGSVYGYWYNLYTILPFLFPNHVLHPASVKRFLTLKPGLLLVDWFEELITYNDSIFKHFSQYEDINKGITIRALFEKEMGAQLYYQFLRLQTFLRERQENTIPGLDVLKAIISFHEETTIDIGQKLYDRYSIGLLQNGTSSDKVKWVTDRDAYQSMSATQSTATFYKNLPTTEEGLKAHLPQRALAEIGSLLVMDFGKFFFQNTQGLARLEKGFEEIPDPAQQEILLKALLQHRYEVLNLSNCSVLTDEALAVFLSRSRETLKTLTIRHCPKLTVKVISTIASCKNLDELYLSHSEGIEKFVVPRLVGKDLPVQLPRLQLLHLSNCPNLITFNIEALELKELKVDNNPRLTKGVLEAPYCEVLLANTPAQIEWRPLSFIKQFPFGKKKWERFFGDVGIEPPLPPNIAEILSAPCPIWKGKKVIETHLLTLVPETINGQPLTLKILGELVQRPLQGPAVRYGGFSIGEYKDPPAFASHWILLSRDVIPGSRNKIFTDQQQLVNRYPDYEVPHILDTTVAIFMEHAQSGTRLYSDSSWTYTRCQEKWSANAQLVVGGFAIDGLHVHRSGFDHEHDGLGVQRTL